MTWTASAMRLSVAAVCAAVVAVSCGDDAAQNDSTPVTEAVATTTLLATPSTADTGPLSLVAIGDSIPNNAASDCPGCTGFVDQYAAALEEATGRPVTTTNLSQHNGLTLPRLMAELGDFRDELSGADAIIVGIAHNSIELGSDHPCGGTLDPSTNLPADWTLITDACAAASSAEYRPMFDELYSTIAGWREGEPTLLLTINKYSDWLGWTAGHLTPEQDERTVMLHDAWNAMLCESAIANGFECVDIYHAFNGPDGTTPSGDLLARDYVHASQAGNDLIAQELISAGFDALA